MNMDQKDQAARQSETIAGALPETDKKTLTQQDTLDAAPPEPLIADVQGLREEVTEQIGGESEQIIVHRDLSALLERMKDGVTIELSLSRPRFFKNSPSRLLAHCRTHRVATMRANPLAQVAANVLDRAFLAETPNRKWADRWRTSLAGTSGGDQPCQGI